MLVAACWDRSIRRFAYPSMQEMPVLAGAHLERVESVRFSPDGETLFSGGRDGAVRIWDPNHGKLRRTINAFGPVKSLAVVQHQPWIGCSCHNQTVRLYNYDTGEPIFSPIEHADRVMSLAISPDERLIASADATGTIRICELVTGRVLDILPGRGTAVWCLTFTPSGSGIVAATFDGDVFQWSVDNTCLQRRLLEQKKTLRQVLCLPDQPTLACLCDVRPEVALFDLNSGQLRMESISLPGQTPTTFAADHRHWVTGDTAGVIQCWQRGETKPLWSIDAHQAWVQSVAISGDGKTILSHAGPEPVRTWDAETGQSRGDLEIEGFKCAAFAFSSDRQKLAVQSFEGNLAVVDWQTLKVGQYSSEIPADGPMAFCKNSSLLAVASGRSIKILDLSGATPPRVLLGHSQRVHSLAFSPDNKTLASASGDGKVRLWNVALGQEVLSLGGIERWFSVTFSPDGARLFACGELDHGHGELHVWDARTELSSHILVEKAALRPAN
jgi:WD40 repeat protein